MTQEMSQYYARRAAEDDHVYALPHWQPGLARLRELVPRVFAGRRVLEVARARVAHLANVELRHAAAYAPPAGRETFDAGLAGLWLSHVDRGRMDEFLAAFHARLEPGAAVLMFDERDDPTRTARPGHTDGAGNRYEWRRLQNGETYEIIKNLFDERELVALLARYAHTVEVEDPARGGTA